MQELLNLLLVYLIGSITFAYFVGKIFFKKDIRNEGSKNLGTTNAVRTLGKKAGTIVLLGDVLKGYFALYLVEKIGTELPIVIFAVVVILGHCYSVFANFKGGKAVATTVGVLMFLSIEVLTVVLIAFAITLLITKYVSLSSMIATTIGAIYTMVYLSNEMIYLMIFIALFIIYKHKENIKRLIKKEEPKAFKKNK